MRHFLNKVNSFSVVCILILLQTTATVCFYEIVSDVEIRISEESELSDGSIVNEVYDLEHMIVERVVITNNSFTTLPEDVFDSLSNLTKLKVNQNPLTTLPANIFRKLKQLKVINFNENQLKALPANIFQGQVKLEEISLSENNLIRLYGNIFADTHNLTTLDLSGNQLAALYGNIFNGLSKLERLSLGNNELKVLPENIFNGLSNLKSLYLDKNHLEALPSNIFKDLGSLKSLRLTDNQLITLPEEIFNGLHSLTNLALGWNNLTSLSANVFTDLHNLSHLQLSKNQLTELPENIFRNLGKLMALEINKNQLSSLPENVFSGLHRLWSLNLEENVLKTLPKNIFNDLNSLFRLSLVKNNLTTLLANIFESCEKLWTLKLTSNQISVLPGGIFDDSHQLDNIQLDNNQLKNLSATIFQNQMRLRELNLNQNQLTELPENIFQNLTDLIELNLSENKLTTLPKNIFSKQRQLSDPNAVAYHNKRYDDIRGKINLHGNPWQCDAEFLEIVKSLKGANMSDIVCGDGQLIGYKIETEKLSHVCPTECNCRSMNKETTLDINCSSGNLTTIPSEMGKGLQQIPELREIILNLDNNDIETLPNSTLPGFGLITKITAKNNSIESFDFDNLPPNLSEIDLSGNKLESLSPEVIEELSNMEFLNKLVLAGNPWKCDDAFVDFVRFNSKMVDYEKIICNDGELVNKKVDELVFWIKVESEMVFMPWQFSDKVIRILKREDDQSQICPPECSCWISDKNTTISYHCVDKSVTRILNHFYSGKRYWPNLERNIENYE